MEEIYENLAKFFDMNGLSQKDVAERMGTSTAYVNAILNGRKSIGKKQAAKMENLFGLSSSWLLTGHGVMVLKNGQSSIGNSTTPTQTNGNRNINDMPNNYRGCGDAEQALYTVPLLPISAQGGALNEFVASVKDSDCERIISPISGVDFAITVSGDSMAPEYPSGSQILIKRINERAFIDWGKTYVLDTCNGTVIKNLYPSENKGKVTCKSINPSYPSFDISLTDIYGIYRVLMCMSVK